MKTKILSSFLVGLFISVAGCIDDTNQNPQFEQEDNISFQLSFDLPGIEAITSKALQENDENYIETVDLLIFKEEGTEEQYFYNTHGYSINNDSPASKSCRANLRACEEGEKHRVLFFINLRQEIEQTKDAFEGKTKEEVINLVTFNANENWDTGTTPRYLPMWGQTPGTYFINPENRDITFTPIQLLRSVARIDIGLSFDEQGNPTGLPETEFRLKEIRLYRTHKKGLAAPLEGNYNKEAKRVTTPSIPENPENHEYLSYILPDGTYGLVREMYVPEFKNTGTSDEEAACVLLKGNYEQGADTWYKLDFIDMTQTENQPKIDILRNHKYIVNITAVAGPGYDTEETALRSKPMNITSDIIAWDQGNMRIINGDGQYQLSSSTDTLFFYRQGREQAFNLYTDHPDGWAITAKSDWLIVSTDEENDNEWDTLLVSAGELGEHDSPREGYILIKAGRIVARIIIVQSSSPEVSILVDPASLVFKKSAYLALGATITSYPENLQLHFSRTGNISGWVRFAEESRPGYYLFQPEPRTGEALQDTLLTIVTIFAEHEGMIGTANLIIRQTPSDLLFELIENAPYSYEGGDQIFKVKTDVKNWWVSGVTDNISNPIIQIEYGKESQYFFTAPEAGQEYECTYPFIFFENQTYENRSVILTVQSEDPEFEPQTVRLTQAYNPPFINTTGSGNEYLLDDSGTPLIVSFETNSAWKFEPRSEENFRNTISQIEQIKEDGTYEELTAGATYTGAANALDTYTGQLRVTPSYKDGAVAGMPPAETLSTSVVWLSTANHPGATADREELTFKRTIPAFFTFTSVSQPTGTNLLSEGQTINLYANTNAAWTGIVEYVGQNRNEFNAPAATYGPQTLPVIIEANTTWDDRTIKIYTRFNTQEELVAEYTQPGLRLNLTSIFLQSGGTNTVRNTGDKATLTFTGIGGPFAVRAVAFINGTDWMLQINQPTLTTSATKTIDLPNNHTVNIRTIYFQVTKDGKEWENITNSYTQERGAYAYKVAGINFVISPTHPNINGDEGEASSWAYAMGVPLSYNSTRYSATSDVNNHSYTPTLLTGCGAYYLHTTNDEVNGQLKWRLPSNDYMRLVVTQFRAESSRVPDFKYYPNLNFIYITATEDKTLLGSYSNSKNLTVQPLLGWRFVNDAEQKSLGTLVRDRWYRCIRNITLFELGADY